MPQYRITYFNSKGRAEVMRQILAYGGQDFEDKRLDPEQWMDLKKSEIIKNKFNDECKIIGSKINFIYKYM